LICHKSPLGREGGTFDSQTMPYWTSSRVGAVPQQNANKAKKRSERYARQQGITMEVRTEQTAAGFIIVVFRFQGSRIVFLFFLDGIRRNHVETYVPVFFYSSETGPFRPLIHFSVTFGEIFDEKTVIRIFYLRICHQKFIQIVSLIKFD
jgi:hypothetical protein